MTTTIVSSKWLFEHINDPDLIVLEARLDPNQSNLENQFQDIQICGARIFDIKNHY